jgi:hypothetical protein
VFTTSSTAVSGASVFGALAISCPPRLLVRGSFAAFADRP